MRPLTIICFAVLLIASACNPSLSGILSALKNGQAIIQYADGKYSSSMTIPEAFAQLKSDESLFLGPGRIELTNPLEIENLSNIKIVGNNTSLVAKIDMPVITFTEVSTVTMKNLLVVHEIGEWCAQNCVEFYKSSNLDISNCKFDGSGYFGLALTDVDKAIIKDNKFYNCEFGLSAWGSSNLIARNNEFSGNRGEDIATNGDGQYSNDVMKDNTFMD